MKAYVDPGESGGIAWTDEDGTVRAAPMPKGMTAQIDFLHELCSGIGAREAVIEKTGGYMPGNSGPAAAKFARHCGHLEAACYVLGYSTTQVAPGVWQRKLGALPKDKYARKRAIKEMMQRKYPHLRVTLQTADALGMLSAG